MPRLSPYPWLPVLTPALAALGPVFLLRRDDVIRCRRAMASSANRARLTGKSSRQLPVGVFLMGNSASSRRPRF